MDFGQIRTIAVVGISANPERPSFQVAKYLQEAGYRIIPVNPTLEEVLGEKSYPGLEAVPPEIQIDVVDIFRRSEDVLPIAQAAVRRGIPVVWMQEGIINEEAAGLVRQNGGEAIMDLCMKKEHQRVASAVGG